MADPIKPKCAEKIRKCISMYNILHPNMVNKFFSEFWGRIHEFSIRFWKNKMTEAIVPKSSENCRKYNFSLKNIRMVRKQLSGVFRGR